MKKLASIGLAGLLAAATLATTIAAADAGWRGRGYYGPPRGGCVGCGFAAGAVTGLALGAIVAPRVYYPPPPPPRYYYAPRYVAASQAHIDWCYSRYRSYNAETNTFIGYDGYPHECVGPY